MNREEVLVYVEALEEVNEELIFTLKGCLRLLASIKFAAPDQDEWQGMLDAIENILKSREIVKMGKRYH
ncbi:MAG: hypothetical protein P8175_10700 [Deltaproteobacteria bacterium]|jgi:hypothetical protein